MVELLDTDTCIGVLRQRPGMVQRMSQVAPADCFVSVVTVYELFCGLAKAQDPAKERRKIERFVSAIIEIPLDRTGAEAAANSRAELERLGTPIGPYDLLIAGQAIASGLTLVTNNVREFNRVNGLKLEAWAVTTSERTLNPVTAREFNDLPRDGTKTASIRLMKIAEDVRKHAGEQGIAEEEARKTGMEEKSREFVENGAEVYAKV